MRGVSALSCLAEDRIAVIILRQGIQIKNVVRIVKERRRIRVTRVVGMDEEVADIRPKSPEEPEPLDHVWVHTELG